MTEAFFAQIRTQAEAKKLLSLEHFSVRGLQKVKGGFSFAAAVFNLVRLKNFEGEPALA